tara:strand:+ start:212 stop:1615 length:1404 start_codon:yes stop_codon:yes gene_type:complete
MVNATDRAVPETAEQLEETLLDDDRRTEIFSDGEKTKTFLRKYATAWARKDQGETDAQMREQMATVLQDFHDKNGVKPGGAVKRLPMDPEVSAGGNGRVADPIYSKLGMTAYQKRQIAATGTGAGMQVEGFEDLVDFAKAISPHITHSAIDTGRVKVLGEGQGDQGGFLVPEEFRAELLMLALESAVVRPRARVLPMATPSVRIPTIRDTTHATNVHGGVQAYWVPESGTITQSEPSFGQAALTAKKLLGGTRVTNELLRDSAITFEPLINSLFADALAYFEDDAFIAGIGGGQPVGILNADALVSVAKETGQAATTVVTENIVKMYSRLLPASLPRAVWIANNDVKPQLFTLSLSVGTGGAPMFFPAGGITGSPTDSLLGRPVIYSEKCETLGAAGDIYLVDLSYYLIGDRQALEMASSPHVRFNTDETDFRFIQRVDGRPWLESALTPRNGSNTLSPFVALAARS